MLYGGDDDDDDIDDDNGDDDNDDNDNGYNSYDGTLINSKSSIDNLLLKCE